MKQTELQKVIKDIKRGLMLSIILNLRHYTLTVEEAKYLARDFLAMLPVSTIDETFQKLSLLGKSYKEARIVYLKYAVPYYETKEKRILAIIPEYIKNGHINTAISLLKGVTNHE